MASILFCDIPVVHDFGDGTFALRVSYRIVPEIQAIGGGFYDLGAFDVPLDSIYINTQLNALLLQGILDTANAQVQGAQVFTATDVLGGRFAALPINRGTAVLDFGTAAQKKTETSAVIGGQTYLPANALPRAYLIGTSTADNDEDSHIIASSLVSLVCGNIVAAASFTIFGFSDGDLTGQFRANWAWN